MYSISVVQYIEYFHETNWKSMFIFIFWIINNVVMETSLFLITIHDTGIFVPKMLWWYQIWHDVNKTWAFVKFVKAKTTFNRECSMINDMMSSALNALVLVSSFCQHNLWKMRIKNCSIKRLFTMHPSNGEFVLWSKYGYKCDWVVCGRLEIYWKFQW